MIVALALVIPKANRVWQAWLILIPMLLVLALWQMPVRLVSMPSSSAGFFGLIATSLAVAWTVIWLLGHRLMRGHWMAGFLSALSAMLAIGAWAYMGDYGFALNSEMLTSMIAFGTCALALLVAMGLARLCSRRLYRPGRFMAWLFLWMLLAPATVVFPFVVCTVIAVSRAFDPSMLVMMVVSMAVMSGFLGVSLYLLNLPFMILAFKSPFYQERFQAGLALRRASEGSSGDCPFHMDPAGSSDGPQEAECLPEEDEGGAQEE